MMTATDQFVVVLPDGREHFVNKPSHLSRTDSRPWEKKQWHDRICQEAVRAGGLTTSRQDPQSVPVRLYQLMLENGRLLRNPVGTHQVTPPCPPRTEAEYTAERDEILAEVPEPFRGFVSHWAWEHGHAYGYDECLGIARDLVYALKEPIRLYTESLQLRAE